MMSFVVLTELASATDRWTNGQNMLCLRAMKRVARVVTLTFERALTDDPLTSNTLTTSSCPDKEATCKAVFPFWFATYHTLL